MRGLLFFSILVFSLTVLAWVYVRDDSPPWDEDLQPEQPSVSAVIPQAPARLHLALDSASPPSSPDLMLRSPWEWDTPSLSHLVAENAHASDNLKDLLSEDDWQPAHPAWKVRDMSGHEHWRALGVAREAAVAYYSRRGQDDVAMQAGLELAALAKRLQSIEAWPGYYSRGAELHERACKAIATLLRQTRIDPASLEQMQADFERHAPSANVLRERLNGYYQFEHRLIIGSHPGDPWDQPAAGLMADHPNRLFFKPNKTLALFATSLRELKDQAVKGPAVASSQIVRRIGPQGRPTGVPGGPNRSGMRYANERIWRYASLVDYLSLQRARHALVLTLFGARRYALEHGIAPKTLNDLVPGYFTALPTDPYTSEPVRYDAARGLIYSVGMDFKPQGGHGGEEPLADDNEPTVMVR